MTKKAETDYTVKVNGMPNYANIPKAVLEPIIDIFGLKRFIVIAGVTTRRKFITYVFFQVFDVSHNDYLLKII